MEQTAYLILQNGQVFTGKRFGADGDVTGEVVFCTSMVGYVEALTDPNYYGQIVVQTFPLIGNYGINASDFESKNINPKAYIVYEYCQEPSNFRSEGCLDIFLKENNIIGLYDVDTRGLTKALREGGTMNGMITSSVAEKDKYLEEIKAYKIAHAVSEASDKKSYVVKSESPEYQVVLWDMGAKQSLRNELANRGLELINVPYNTTAKQIMEYKADGVVISDGPGDPADNEEIVKQIKLLLKNNIPILGIGLGHQLIALAEGAKTYKLQYGHRGGSQPVKDINSDRIYITSQNHGYAVDVDTIPENAEANYINANDKTCEGIIYKDKPVFSVQFQPISSAGPLDTGFLFDKFVSMMKGVK